MSYLAYFGNIDGGTAMIDSFGQLRIVLHLFNAFKKVGAFMPGDIVFLDWLDKQFADSKAVWEGERPEKGRFTLRWLISWRMDISKARGMASEIQTKATTSASPTQSTRAHGRGMIVRQMTAIQPKELATSYRRICCRDFSDLVDKYHTAEQKRKEGSTDIYHHTVRVNDTLDAMLVDGQLLGTNLTSLGELLNEFIASLFRLTELEPLVNKIVRETPVDVRMGRRTDLSRVTSGSWEASDANLERQAQAHLLAECVLGALDFQDKQQVVCAKCVMFMKMFFTEIPAEKFLYFMT